MHNASLRICLGLTKTTPVTAILAEAAEWPIELILKFQCCKFLAKHLGLNTQIGRDIKNLNSSNTLNNLYAEFPILKNIAVINYNKLLYNNLVINCDIENYSKNQTQQEKKHYALKYIEKYQDNHEIYTDGSKTDEGVGLGIYFKDTDEKIHRFYTLDICIKTTEIMAIFLALKLALSMGKINIVVYTDSQSSCKAIETSLSNHKPTQIYEHKIIELANKFSQSKISIQWIPAHVGIHGNEIADKLAGLRPSHSLEISNDENNNILIPVHDAIRMCRRALDDTWKQTFTEKTQLTGKFHGSVMGEPKLNLWFKKTSLTSSQLKQILRLRSGHTFDKKHLYLLKLTDTNLCTACNVIEDTEHVIKHCVLFNSTRQKYKRIENEDLAVLLRNNSKEDLLEINNFLKEIKYHL